MTGPAPEALAAAPTLEALYGQLSEISVGTGWNKPTPSLWAEPRKTYRPFQWRYAQGKSALDAAGRLINTELAERRNLILANPAGDGYATARTLISAYQMIMPGERARSHRHTPNALRLILDAEPGSYTVVNGAKLPMMPGDVVLTPNWSWHGHGNEGKANAYWLDVLDVPLVQLIEPMFFEPHPQEFEADAPIDFASPLIFPWRATVERLDAEDDRDGVAEIELGEPAFETMKLSMIRLEAERATPAKRTTANAVYCVAKGSGSSVIDGERFEWWRGDVLVVPSWRETSHRAAESTVLFRVGDEPVLEKLGFLRTKEA